MTTEEFKRLPLMLSRRTVIQVTGWSKHTFYKQVECGELKPVKTLPGGKQLFRKQDFAAVIAPA